MNTPLLDIVLAQKQAATVGPTIAGGIVSNVLDVRAPLSRLAGLSGFFKSPGTEEEKQQLVQEPGVRQLLAGNAQYDVGRRLAGVGRESIRGGASPTRVKAHLIAEQLGGLLAPLAGAAIGFAATPGYQSDRQRVINTLAGAGIGAGAGLIGALAALIRRRRTESEQTRHDSSGVGISNVLPGVASYNMYKRLGRSRDWDDKYGPRAQDGSEKKTARSLKTPLLDIALEVKQASRISDIGKAVKALAAKARGRVQQEASRSAPLFDNPVRPGDTGVGRPKQVPRESRPVEFIRPGRQVVIPRVVGTVESPRRANNPTPWHETAPWQEVAQAAKMRDKINREPVTPGRIKVVPRLPHRELPRLEAGNPNRPSIGAEREAEIIRKLRAMFGTE